MMTMSPYMFIYIWTLLVIVNGVRPTTISKCYQVDEEVTFCINAETAQLKCPIGHRLNIRWAELRRAEQRCRTGVLMPSQEACLIQRVTSELKAQCDNHLLCEPSIQNEDKEINDCSGATTNDFLHVWYRCNPETISQRMFNGMCDTKTVSGSVVHVISSQESMDLGCSCSILVPGNTEIEVLAQQTKEISRLYGCPQTIHVQDGDISKQYCLPDKMGVVTQMNCNGKLHKLTLFYTHIKVRGHKLTLKASFNVNLNVSCGPLYLGTPPATPRVSTDPDTLSSHEKLPQDWNPGPDTSKKQHVQPDDHSIEEQQPQYDAAVLGGVVGATMCVILVLSAILIYLLWQRKLERDRARKKAAYHMENGDNSDNDLEDTQTVTEQISARPTPSTSGNFNFVPYGDSNKSPTTHKEAPNGLSTTLRELPDGGENNLNASNGVQGKTHALLPSVNHHTNNNAVFSSDFELQGTGIDQGEPLRHNQCDTDV